MVQFRTTLSDIPESEPPVTEPLEEYHFVVDGAANARVDVAGANIVRRGHVYEHIPRISRADYSSLVMGTMPSDEMAFEERVSRVVMPDMAEHFRIAKRVVKTRRADGLHEYTLVPNVPGVTYEPIEDFIDFKGPPPVGSVPAKKRYSLAQFFFDSYVIDKFSLTSRTIQTVKRLALAHPHEAARYLQDAVRETPQGANVTIDAGDYSRSKKKCVSVVWNVCKEFAPVTAAITATVVGENVFLHEMGAEENGWCIQGPCKYLDILQALYNMVCIRGTAEPMFILGMELVLLQVEIYNGHRYESPTLIDHVAPYGIELRDSPIAESFGDAMTIEKRTAILRTHSRIRPVFSGLSDVVASSVQLTSRHALLNEHVAHKVPDATFAGQAFSLVKSVSRDLWVIKIQQGDDVIPWLLRTPKVGELCLLVYHDGIRVQESEPVQVTSFDGVNVFVTKTEDARPGVSGAALVAVEDAALLGIHLGETQTSCVCAHYGQSQFSDMVDLDTMSQVARQHASAGDSGSVYSALKQRGLHSVVDTTIQSLMPLYSGSSHVGMAAVVGKAMVTTVDPDVDQVELGHKGLPLTFSRLSAVQYAVDNPVVPSTVTTPAVIRKPNPREKVFVVGADSESPYFSELLTVVHVGVGAKTFSLSDMPPSDFPFFGGLVVAVADAAVVGQYVGSRVSMTRGALSYCCSIDVAALATPRVSVVSYLATKFPMLSPTAWDMDVVRDMVTHTSCHDVQLDGDPSGMLKLAAIGGAAARVAVRVWMRESGLPHAEWAAVEQQAQSGAAYARLAWSLGLASFMKVGDGISLPATSKGYADLMGAIMGVVSLYETRETFMSFCRAVRVVPAGVEDESEHD